MPIVRTTGPWRKVIECTSHMSPTVTMERSGDTLVMQAVDPSCTMIVQTMVQLEHAVVSPTTSRRSGSFDSDGSSEAPLPLERTSVSSKLVASSCKLLNDCDPLLIVMNASDRIVLSSTSSNRARSTELLLKVEEPVEWLDIPDES